MSDEVLTVARVLGVQTWRRRVLCVCSTGLNNWKDLMDLVSYWNTFCGFGQQWNYCWLCLIFSQLCMVGGNKPYLLHTNGDESSLGVPGTATWLRIKHWLQIKPLHRRPALDNSSPITMGFVGRRGAGLFWGLCRQHRKLFWGEVGYKFSVVFSQ